MKATGALYEVGRSPAIPVGAAVGWAGAVAILYFLAARLGLALLAQPSDVAVFWPASGVAAGILILSGRRTYPALIIGVVIGTVAANLMSDRGVWTSVFNGFCNAGEAVLMAWLLERWFGRTFTFGDIHRVVGFFAAAGIAVATSAVGGATTMTLLHGAGPFWDVWRAWFLSDGVGITVVAPLVIGLGTMWREPPSRGEVIEGVGVLVLLALTSIFVVTQSTGSWLSFSPGAAVLPLLLWLAARSDPTFAIAGAFFASGAVICATNFGIGRFGDAAIPLFERAKGAQAAVMTVTAYTLFLAALFAERRQREMALKMAVDGAKLGAFSADLATGHLRCDLRTARMHGHTVPPTTIKESRRFVHRDDLIRIDAALAKVGGTGGVWNAEYRVMHPPNHPHAGETRWVAVESSLVCDSQGVPKGLLGVTRDITHQKEAEQALGERNMQLSLAGKSARVGSYAYNPNTDAMQIDAGYAALHGLPEGTAETTRSEWRARAHPEDRVRIESMRSRAFRERWDEYDIEYRIVRSGGEVRWIESRSFISYATDGHPERVVGINIDITERKRAEEHLQAMNAELDHRVKNVLATASAVAAQTLNASSSLEHFVSAFDGRLRSMAQTHELLSERLWRGVPLAELLRRELAPYARGYNTEIGGPEVILTAEAGQTLAMVFHELATNAAKHGAFSSRQGKVSVDWHTELNGNARAGLVIEWQETGGPAAKAESKAGYGISVICELIPHELAGKVNHVLTPEGARCQLELPGRWIDASSTN